MNSSLSGSFSAGSVSPSEKFSVNFVALTVPPNFTLCAPCVYEMSHLDADVPQLTILGHRAWLVRERIRTRRVRDLVLSDVDVRGEQHLRADDARVAGRDVDRRDLLVLRLAGVVLIERVRHVERRPRHLHIQMQRVDAAGAQIQAIEERLTVP